MQVQASADLVEAQASSALVCLVMRLSEVELRPLFLHLCEWKAAVAGDGPQATLGVLDRRLSFYRVLDGLAAALKVRCSGAAIAWSVGKPTVRWMKRLTIYCIVVSFVLVLWRENGCFLFVAMRVVCRVLEAIASSVRISRESPMLRGN